MSRSPYSHAIFKTMLADRQPGATGTITLGHLRLGMPTSRPLDSTFFVSTG